RASYLLDTNLSTTTAATTAHNLPLLPTPFIGRSSELHTIAQRLNDPDCHLLTLIGPGGIGKTRLALQAAEQQVGQFAHGVYFVSLAPVTSPHTMALTIGNTVQYSFYGERAPDIQLINYLRDKHMLLVLDNFEQLLPGVG